MTERRPQSGIKPSYTKTEPSDTEIEPSDTEIPLRDRIARKLIRNSVATGLRKSKQSVDLKEPPPFKQQPTSNDVQHVGIVGAGVAGPYIALLLNELDIKYEILESSKRPGGRIFTKALELAPQGLHDYFDVSAMRFLRSPILQKTFECLSTSMSSLFRTI
ncbi:hypothetical protein BELL_1530g00010 [Botrytis elliptica]|uniref:Amine oxidase domain-containing protein n=1 Tax=Botrytis elliptica TaxID=278938 RepID=A0A4Z1I486_9HELO|nr:hypothetical protein EAE99_011583 [Botrytis elliptica]TGO54272.1 hypothetical protein BELL_1530g00010 [Botrytis elliptica]